MTCIGLAQILVTTLRLVMAHLLDSIHNCSAFGHWAKDPVWNEMRACLATVTQTIVIMELFGGLSTGFIALSALGLSVQLEVYCDHNVHLQHWLKKLHGSSQALRCGKVIGDVLELAPGLVALVHVIIAGPPCPPWSAKGARKSWNDDRSIPFWHTLHIIVAAAHSGSLVFFVLENVVGFTQKQKDGSIPIDDVVALLIEKLPKNWSVDFCFYNSWNFGLAQSRRRVYLVGRKAIPSNIGPSGPPPAKRFVNAPSLASIFDGPFIGVSGARGESGAGYSDLQQANLREWKAAFSPDISNPAKIGSFAVVAYDRTPGSRTSWTPTQSSEFCECLTATGPLLHCFSLVDHCKSLDRTLRLSERSLLQGFPRGYIVDDAMYNAGVTAVGNAMSVPVVAAVCFREVLFQVQNRSDAFRAIAGVSIERPWFINGSVYNTLCVELLLCLCTEIFSFPV